jgi:hypothetical protein
MKKYAFISLFLMILIGIVFFSYKKFFSTKIDFKPVDKITESLLLLSQNSTLEKQIKVFEIVEDRCQIIATLEGKELLEKFKVAVSFKINLIGQNSKKEKVVCVEKTMKVLISIFESKKTKQEFIKFTKDAFADFRGKEINRDFFDKNVKITNEKGELIILIN